MIGHGLDVSVPTIRVSADDLDRGGGVVRDRSFDLADVWERLRSSYRAPESETLVGVLRLLLVPHGQAVAAVTHDVGLALHAFATAVEPVVQALEALASADQSDPGVQAEIDRQMYKFAQAEVACSDAIRVAIGQDRRDLGLLQHFAPAPQEPTFFDWLLFGAQSAEYADGIYSTGRALRTGKLEPGVTVPELPEVPQTVPSPPPLPVPVGGLTVGGTIGVAPLGLLPLAVGGEVRGQYVPDPVNPDLRPPPQQILVIERDTNGRARDTLNGPLQGDTRYVIDDGAYIYETDHQGRVVHAEGRLDTQFASGDQVRDPYRQSVVPGRLTGDQGGHLIAAQFDGPGERINLVPQAKSTNQQFLKLETQWRTAVRHHQQVRVKIDLVYPDGADPRPSGFLVGSVTSSTPAPPNFTGQTFPVRAPIDNPRPPEAPPN